MSTRQYSFAERAHMSDGIATVATVEAVLLANIPDAQTIRRANHTDDRHGTDWWVHRQHGRPLSVDAKVREQDYYVLRGNDDLALELWSVKETGKVGWTRNPTKQTDYVLWLWTDTGRWCLLPFPLLCAVFAEHASEWASTYKTAEQFTPEFGGYHSECVFVPRPVVWRAMYDRYGGRTGSLKIAPLQ